MKKLIGEMRQHNRYVNKSLRLKEYDYSHAGAYFITVCTFKRKCLFGEVVKEKMKLNALGKIANACLADIPTHFRNTEIAEYIVMPNHIHAVVYIYDEDIVGGRYISHLQDEKSQKNIVQERQYQKLPVIMGTYKAAVTRDINELIGNKKFRWQQSYHDHIIRNEKSLARICEYTRQNPANWEHDLENENYINNLTAGERQKRLKQFYKKLAK